MNRVLWLLAGIAGLVVALWVALAFLIFSGHEHPVEPSAASIRPESIPSPEAPEPPISRDLSSSPPVPVSLPEQNTQNSSLPAQADVDEAPWQQVIQGILMNDGEPAMLSGRLALALPGLPLEGQMEAAQHMVNLLGDQEYSVAATVYFNSAMPEPVRRLVFEDFMNRPNAVKLPLLVRTLRDYTHPMRTEVIDNLQVFIGRDEGDDPARWEVAVRETLERERREQEGPQASEQ